MFSTQSENFIPFPHIFDIISLFTVEFEKPKIDISRKALIWEWLVHIEEIYRKKTEMRERGVTVLVCRSFDSIYIPCKMNVFGGILEPSCLSVRPCILVPINICKQNISFCQSLGFVCSSSISQQLLDRFHCYG